MTAEFAKGYNLQSTSNGVRLQAAVIVSLARELSGIDPERRPFWLDHRDYFNAYIALLGLRVEEAPAFARIGYENGEDHVVDYRGENVIDEVLRGRTPDLSLNVKAGWRATPGAPNSYTYEDTEASPPLRVTHDRVSAYRVLVYDDIVVYDSIEGVYGRATAGLLGLAFRIMGDGRAVSSRIAISEDGLQVTRTSARKGPIRITQTATVFPDGVAQRGILRNRPDLEAIEDELRTPLRIRYVELDMQDTAEEPTDDCPSL